MTNTEKAERIIDLYKSRENRQIDLSKKLGIPLKEIRTVTQEFGYSHGKKKNMNNLCKDQTVKPIYFENERENKLSFLGKYPDDIFESE